MTSFAKTIAALALAAVALPTATLAQGTAMSPIGAATRSAIADLDGSTRLVSAVQADAFGLDTLPVGQAYGIKDSRIVVLDDAGTVLDIVRVIAINDSVNF